MQFLGEHIATVSSLPLSSVTFPHILHHTNTHRVSRVYFSLCPCFLAAAQYSSQGSGSETLRVSLRVSGSGSEGRVRAKHHNTRDNGGFMPFASYGRRPDGETDKERETLWANFFSPRRHEKISICEILRWLIIFSLRASCVSPASVLCFSVLSFCVPRPGPRSITISDVTRMQMWKLRREHHRQHCHNHGILSYNYNQQKYTRQLDI